MLLSTEEVLIYLEHNGEVNAKELRNWKKASLKGIIGKLEAQSLIERTKQGKEIYYKLSSKGIEYIDNILECLHDNTCPSKDWIMVSFGISENNRSNRDKLRRYLQKLGFGNLYGSTWVLPYRDGIIDSIYSYANKLNVSNNLVAARASCNEKCNQNISKNGWDMENIAKQYNNFIRKYKPIIQKLKKDNPNTKLIAKTAIYILANIINNDPNLPEKLLPKKWPKKDALELYQGARKYLN